jgi:hypothetical protein
MPQQSKDQRGTVERVMHEYKEGELKTGRGKGPKVKSRKQAIAIALHESGSTNQEPPKKNRQNLRRTKSKERQGETAEAEREGKSAQNRTVEKGESRGRSDGSRRGRGSSRGGETKASLYARARQRNISGRSTMSKAELQRALSH